MQQCRRRKNQALKEIPSQVPLELPSQRRSSRLTAASSEDQIIKISSQFRSRLCQTSQKRNLPSPPGSHSNRGRLRIRQLSRVKWTTCSHTTQLMSLRIQILRLVRGPLHHFKRRARQVLFKTRAPRLSRPIRKRVEPGRLRQNRKQISSTSSSKPPEMRHRNL